MQHDIDSQRSCIRESQRKLQALKDGVYDTVQYILDETRFKSTFLALFNEHVQGEVRMTEVDSDIKNEYDQQTRYLHKNE
jgi:hypothetical protein